VIFNDQRLRYTSAAALLAKLPHEVGWSVQSGHARAAAGLRRSLRWAAGGRPILRNCLIQQLAWSSTSSPSRRIGVSGKIAQPHSGQKTSGHVACSTRPSGRKKTFSPVFAVSRQTTQRGNSTWLAIIRYFAPVFPVRPAAERRRGDSCRSGVASTAAMP